MRILQIVGIYAFYFFSIVEGQCVVESHRCGFPFSSSPSSSSSLPRHYSCQASNALHFCYSQVGARHVYGVCNGGCFQEDGVTPIIFEEDDAMAFFCKTAASPCQFPFIWNGTTYTSCTRDGSEFLWCALEVDSERVVVDRRWGSCDMSTCTPVKDLADDLTHGQREARAVFEDDVTGVMLLTQRSSMNPLKIEGRLEGVPSGQYRLRVMKGACDEVEYVDDTDLIESDDDVAIISLEKWGVSLFEGEENVLGGSLSVDEECFLGEGSMDCSQAKRITCANIVKESEDGLNITMVIIIALVVCIVIILILVGILVICCLRRRLPPSKPAPHNPNHSSLDSIDDPYLENRRSKSPLYDELSIPFIDASLPPTPKVGRSSNPLDILLGKNIGSRTSLSDTT
eukprot:TRINITY_DN21223_c0_g1_i6.p1 TRINITY_DN21223_c0_g1~~TRINITY_DN21223_c0_g1_i6.p1  ORF type:complete len:399 (-),score=107.26 TRINITY_DN21223_c0_g1_i6:610-1806(-)